MKWTLITTGFTGGSSIVEGMQTSGFHMSRMIDYIGLDCFSTLGNLNLAECFRRLTVLLDHGLYELPIVAVEQAYLTGRDSLFGFYDRDPRFHPGHSVIKSYLFRLGNFHPPL